MNMPKKMNRWGKPLILVAAVLLTACSINAPEGTAKQYISEYDRNTGFVSVFDIRSVTGAPEQLAVMFRVNGHAG